MNDVTNISTFIPTNYYFLVVSRIIISVIIGGIIGFEREHKNRPAGFRTHILVCVSSCSLMILSELVFLQYYTLYGLMSDPQRLSAQVVSGIGFLGAGTIIHYGTSVKGLTTAASIWAVAALGLICGSGFFFLAFFGLIVIEVVLITFDRYAKRDFFKPKTIELFLTIVHNSDVVGNLMIFIAENNLELIEMNFHSLNESISLDSKESISKLKLVLDPTNCSINTDDLINNLEKQKGIISVKS